MTTDLLKVSLFVFTAFVLSACASGPRDPDTGVVFSTSSLPDQKFVVGDFNEAGDAPPKPVNELTDDEFRNALSALDAELCKKNDTLEKCIQRLNRPNAIKNFKGVSGITGDAFLRTAESKKNANNKREVTVKGQILANCAHDPLLSGYHYDQSTGKLRLCVLMMTTIENAKNENNKVRYQYFHVEATSARVEKRGGNPSNIFPAAAMATGLTIKATPENAHLEYKLYAKGKNIKVVTYWEANAKKKSDTPNWTQYPKQGMPPRIAEYFKADKDACIDMMFPASGVPATLDPNAVAGVHYCLGRCKNPPIVNTR